MFVRLAAHPLRWRLLTELAASDRRVRELVDAVGQPQNLVSYHLRLLEAAGWSPPVEAASTPATAITTWTWRAVRRRCPPSGRLHPALRRRCHPTFRASANAGCGHGVLFACTGNSARSPIAEALLRHRAGGDVEVVSAGSHPKPRIHPNAARVLREQYGIDIADHRPRHLDTVARRQFDYVITLCDKVREACPEFSDQPRLIHWSIPDPAAANGTDRQTYPAFWRTAAEIDTRIRYLLPVFTHIPEPEVQP